MTIADFEQLIQSNREHRHLEVKGPMAWEGTDFRCKICKNILGMSNIRDGGYIIIGISESGDKSFELSGMTQEQSITWTLDGILSFANEYADPYVNIDLAHVDYQNKYFVALHVREFEFLPVICKKDGANGLTKGAIYTRTYRMPETAVVPSQTEMREMLDIAVEKQLAELRSRLYRAGFLSIPQTDEREESRSRFESQLEDF